MKNKKLLKIMIGISLVVVMAIAIPLATGCTSQAPTPTPTPTPGEPTPTPTPEPAQDLPIYKWRITSPFGAPDTEEDMRLNYADILNEMSGGRIEATVYEPGELVPEGEVVTRSEAPRGEVVYYLRSNGSDKPARLKVRTPTLAVLSLLPEQLSAIHVADIPVVLAGIDLCIACADR